MKDKFKNKNAITLIALVITIIVLLILAGVTVATITGENGLLSKAVSGRENYKNATKEETDNIAEYSNKIAEMIGNRENNLANCSISISNTGVISVANVNNMKMFVVAKNNKYLDTSTQSEYNLELPVGEKANIYVIAMDENMKLYQSNVVEYESKTLYLYSKGTENSTISGWSDNGGDNFSKSANSIYLRLNDGSGSSSSSAAINFSGINSTGYTHLCIELENVYCNTTDMSIFIAYNGWIPTESFDSWEQTYDGTAKKTIDINLTDKNISLSSFYLGWCCGRAQYFMRENWGSSNDATGEGYFNLKSVYLYK